jgi:hypothetical protein
MQERSQRKTAEVFSVFSLSDFFSKIGSGAYPPAPCRGRGRMPVRVSFAFAIHTRFADLGPYPGDFGMRDNPVMICVFTIGEIGR